MITVYYLIEDVLPERRLRRRGLQPALLDSEMLSIPLFEKDAVALSSFLEGRPGRLRGIAASRKRGHDPKASASNGWIIRTRNQRAPRDCKRICVSTALYGFYVRQ